ncbi:MAG: lytic transglycosylase domain-containing protein [Alphaproteobacteria bacterium]|nr:lytic transglycosylase domain-containing protein [Alphaproteobacteria bacterium]
MTGLRNVLLVAIVFGGTAVLAQPAGPTPPAGSAQRASVVRMAPIASGTDGITLNTERRPGLVRFLSVADRQLYLQAFSAAERKEWANARTLAAQARDNSLKRVVEWRYLLDQNSGATFNELAVFLRANPEWPSRDALYARAEGEMDGHLSPQTVLAFFQGRDAVSAIGKVRLGEAYIATGQATKGASLVRDAWRAGDFELDQESEILRRHADILTPDSERARFNRLMFQGQLSAAQREMPRLPSDAQAVAAARLALARDVNEGLRLIPTLPGNQQYDPVLMWDRFELARKRSDTATLLSFLSRAPMRDLAAIDPERAWGAVSGAARQAIQNRSFTTAHSLIAYSGLSAGTEYAEAQFLAGWLDLRFLRNPREAHTHFVALAGNVTRPISRSRGYYWAGRASEAAGQYAQAREDYRAAAQSPQTFYGELALAKLDPAARLHVPETAADATPAELAHYQARDLTHVMHALGDLGLVAFLRVFATYDVETHPEAKHAKLLASDLAGMGFPDVGIRVAKNAAYRNMHFLAYSHPVLPVPGYSGPGYAPEQAFVLAIIRQETEFDPAAISGAGARGLMQLMPDSARRNAGRAGIAYLPNQLLSDPAYNMKLGMVEMAENLASYGGSYLLTAAAYNAGRGNVTKWIGLYGDPRSPVVDPLDWIEEIPFAETRNYVQRVLENMQVYRNRISGRDEPLRILADLYRPRSPDVRPLPAISPAPRSEGNAPESVAGR